MRDFGHRVHWISFCFFLTCPDFYHRSRRNISPAHTNLWEQIKISQSAQQKKCLLLFLLNAIDFVCDRLRTIVNLPFSMLILVVRLFAPSMRRLGMGTYEHIWALTIHSIRIENNGRIFYPVDQAERAGRRTSYDGPYRSCVLFTNTFFSVLFLLHFECMFCSYILLRKELFSDNSNHWTSNDKSLVDSSVVLQHMRNAERASERERNIESSYRNQNQTTKKKKLQYLIDSLGVMYYFTLQARIWII